MAALRTVAIVGGGVAGLAAGCFLAAAGVRVRLFEAGAKLGGCCGTSTIDGYTFSDGALYLMLRTGWDRVREELNLDATGSLPLRRVTTADQTLLPDGTRVSLEPGLQLRVEDGPHRDASRAQRAQAEFTALIRELEPAAQAMTEDLLLRPWSLPRMAGRMWRHLLRLRGSAADHLARRISDEAVRAALGGMLLFGGAPAQQLPALALVTLVISATDGLYLPVGGMGRVPELLGRCLAERGGEVCLDAPVERIAISGGRVRGLAVAGQEFVEADAVISTVSGMLTFTQLLAAEDAPAHLRRKAQTAPLSQRGFSIQLGLARPTDIPGSLNVLPWLPDQARLFETRAPGAPWLACYVPSHTLPELALPGGSTLEVFTFVDQSLPLAAWDDTATAAAAGAALETLGRLHDLDVAVMHVRSPRDLQQQLRLYEGAIYGINPTAGPLAYFPQRAGLPGLYQAGQTTFPGFGVVPSALSGIHAAQAVLRDWVTPGMQ